MTQCVEYAFQVENDYLSSFYYYIVVEYGGGGEGGGAEDLDPLKRFYKGSSAPAEILLNLVAVTTVYQLTLKP